MKKNQQQHTNPMKNSINRIKYIPNVVNRTTRQINQYIHSLSFGTKTHDTQMKKTIIGQSFLLSLPFTLSFSPWSLMLHTLGLENKIKQTKWMNKILEGYMKSDQGCHIHTHTRNQKSYSLARSVPREQKTIKMALSIDTSPISLRSISWEYAFFSLSHCLSLSRYVIYILKKRRRKNKTHININKALIILGKGLNVWDTNK